MSEATPPPRMTQVALNLDDRPKFTKLQLQEYFKRIDLPAKYLDSPVLSDPSHAKSKEHGLPLIRALVHRHVCSVPFENLELHYSLHKKITLDPNDLYTKMVHHRRGGRCMENNTFFGTVLRSLGFEVRNCAGRVARTMSPYPDVRQHQASTYDGWNHMLNLVRLDDIWFVVDVGMGSMGPCTPYPLQDGFEMTSIAPRRIRLQFRAIPETFASAALDETELPKLWCYDVNHNPGAGVEEKWIPTYCFSTIEFLPQDYEIMSWFTSTHLRSFFTSMMMCTKMLMDEGGEDIVGNVTLVNDTVNKMVGGQKELIKECKTEDERIRVLHDVFDVELTDEQKSNIPPDRRLA